MNVDEINVMTILNEILKSDEGERFFIQKKKRISKEFTYRREAQYCC